MLKTNKRSQRESNKRTRKINHTFTKNDYRSGDGMLTTVWGPAQWHYLHCISFNYPVNPTKSDKKHYKKYIYNLRYTLPCKYCRINLSNNLKIFLKQQKILLMLKNY